MAHHRLSRRKLKELRKMKKYPNRNARLMLKRLRSWQQYHAPDPLRHKLPILLMSGYVFTMVIALLFIGLVLDLIIIQFENQLKNEGFAGFAALHSANKSLYSGPLVNLFAINLIELSIDQQNAIKSLPKKLESIKKSLETSKQLFQNLFNHQNIISVKAKTSLDRFSKWNGTSDRMNPQIDIQKRLLSEVSKIVFNQSVFNELIFNMILPVNSYQLQCGRSGVKLGSQIGAQWQLVKSNGSKLLFLASENLSNITELNLFDIIDELNVNISASNNANLSLSSRSVTTFDDGYAVKFKTKVKRKYSPSTVTCGLWLRTK
uniref:Uncharacterized protein n=1 Tax=Tetranychus urticae TaxID=32264 RepID=T1KBI5_TETUR